MIVAVCGFVTDVAYAVEGRGAYILLRSFGSGQEC